MSDVSAEIEKMIAAIEYRNRTYSNETHWDAARCRLEAEKEFFRTNPALYRIWKAEQ